MKRTKRNNKGFSLVELIIVIAIMAILAGILAPQFIKYIGKSRVSTDIQNAQQIATALSTEFADTERTSEVTLQKVDPAKAWDDASATVDTKKHRSQKEVFGGEPKVKADSDYTFAYKISASGEVTVYVTDGQTNGKSYTLYPEVDKSTDTTNKWKQD